MEYKVKRIKEISEIMDCERFEVSNFQWVNGPQPKTYGYMGYLEEKGLYVEMFCEETEPRRICVEPWGRTCKEKGKRVCDDSAMEVFIAYTEPGKKICDDSLYVNFELNANGVMYATYGNGRKNRSFLPESVYEEAAPYAEIQNGKWRISVLFPEKFLKEISGRHPGEKGVEFYCNFYKISETAEIEHYGSFSRIDSETPNFHCPSCFAKAVVQ